MIEIDQSMVYFKCASCEHVFESDPDLFEVNCPQCGSGSTDRI